MRRARVHMFALMAAVAAGPAVAQTVREAALANVQLGLITCIQNAHDEASAVAAFTAAGFEHVPEAYPGGPTLHWFNAPAQTASVMLRATPGDNFCAVHTPYLGVTEAMDYAGSVLTASFPAVGFEPGRTDGFAPLIPGGQAAANAPCDGYVGWNGQRPIVVTLGTAGQDPVCVENGTSQIMVSLP